MIDLRACIPVALGWVVLVVVLSVPAGAAGVAGAAIGVAVVAGGAAGVLSRSVSGRLHRWAERCAVLLLAAAFVGAACGSVAVRAGVRSPPSLVEAAEGSAPVVLAGSVTARSDPETGRATMRVDEATTRIGVTRGEVPVLLLGLPAEAPELDVGDRVVVRARLTATAAGDSVAFLARATDVSVVEPASGVVGWADALRASFRSRAGGLPGDGGALLPGLAIGDTSAVDESLEAAMKGASLTHLTAVSGANCAVVVALVLALGLQLRIPRLVRLGAAALVLALFVVLVTPEPSVLRAAVMALVALVLVAAGRPVRPLPLLAVAVGVLLLVDPWLAREYGFALSVLATAGLVVLAGPLARLFARVVPEPVAVALAVPFAAQLACQPLLITLSPSIPVHGLAANVLAEPAAPVATVLGLVACLVGPVWPGGAAVVAAAAWVPAAWIGAVARFCSSLPGRALPWPAEGWSVALLALLVLLVAGVVLTTPYRRSRRVAVVGLLVVAVPTASVVTGSAVGRTLSFPAEWSVIQCDVGQGDAVLLRSGGGVALVDTGDDEELLSACLERGGVGRLDLLVLTHFDRDHVGAARALVGRVSAVVVGPTDGAEDARLVDDLRRGGASVSTAGAGAVVSLGTASLDVLWPPAGQAPGNGASVVVALDGEASGFTPGAGASRPGPSIVLLGDLGEREQQRLLARGSVPRADVVKVSHHGSRDQSAALYEALAPRVALVGVGASNSYGHPTAETLAMLTGLGATVERSDTEGLVALSGGEGAAADARIDVWSSGPRLSAAAPRLDPGSTTPSEPEKARADGRRTTGGQESRRPHRSARVAPHPTGTRRARLWARAVPRRPCHPPAPRPARRRRPQPRGERPRGRPLHAG